MQKMRMINNQMTTQPPAVFILFHCLHIIIPSLSCVLSMTVADVSTYMCSSVQMPLSDIVAHAGPTLASLVQRGQELVEKLHILKVDRQEFACIKFLILFNPG